MVKKQTTMKDLFFFYFLWEEFKGTKKLTTHKGQLVLYQKRNKGREF